MRVVFHHISGSLKGRRDVFEESIITIGRDPSNLLQFDPIKDVRCSAFHAEIRREGDVCRVRDLGSRNGLFVDGERVTDRELTSGCVLRFGLGGPEARFEIERDREPAARREEPQAGEAGREEPGVQGGGVRIEHLSGSYKGRSHNYGFGVIRVGRNPEFELNFDPEQDLAVSWKHARIEHDRGKWFIEDTNSRNGTLVNGERQTRTALRDGDVIRLGTIGPEVRVHLLSPEDASDRTLIWSDVGERAEEKLREVPTVALEGAGVLVGRDPRCDIVLDHPAVSRRHAVITHVEGMYFVEDLDSTNGTFLNGERVAERREIRDGDRIHITTFVLSLRAGAIRAEDQQGKIRVEAKGVARLVHDRRRGEVERVLDDVSLAIEPREFIGILGRTASGKSSLLDVLSGRRRPDAGAVFFNDDILGEHYDQYRSAIGYVPQEDIVHEHLTVWRVLWYAVRLRLPRDTSRKEARDRVEEILEQTELSERRHRLVRDLSGGEVKRVNLAVELISSPNVLFLDEATAGLDAATDYEIMTLFRRLANEGKTVVCVTHNVEHVMMCDLVALLHKGRLVFYGPPAEMLAHFGVQTLPEVYGKLGDRPLREWEELFHQSESYARYVKGRARHAGGETRDSGEHRAGPLRGGRLRALGRWFGQLPVLTQRYGEILLRDRRGLAISLAQAPLLGLLVGLVFHRREGADVTIAGGYLKAGFVLVLAAIWFGFTNAIREIVRENKIYRRERAVVLSIPPYIASKVIPLAVLCAVQCMLILALVRPLVGMEGRFDRQLATLLMTSVASMILGLLVSGVAGTTDRAVGLVPLLLIPQVVLADAIVRLEGFALFLARMFIIAYWAYDGLKTTLADQLVGARRLAMVALPSLQGADAPGVIGRMGRWPVDLGVLAIFSLVCFVTLALAMRLKDTEL